MRTTARTIRGWYRSRISTIPATCSGSTPTSFPLPKPDRRTRPGSSPGRFPPLSLPSSCQLTLSGGWLRHRYSAAPGWSRRYAIVSFTLVHQNIRQATFLNSLAQLRFKISQVRQGGSNMHKYAPLRRYLKRKKESEIILTFGQIEDIIDAPLPKIAGSPQWWANIV